MEGGLRLIREFREAGLQVLLGNLGWVTDERDAKLRLQMYLMIAEMQRDQIRENSLNGVCTKVRMGQPHGGNAPYGLRFVTKAELIAEAIARGEERPRRPGNEYRRVEAEMQRARRILELIDADHSLREIGRIFEAEGIKAPRGCKRCRVAGTTETCTHWNATFFSEVAHDEFYVTGIWFYNKTRSVEPQRIRSTGPRHRKRSSQAERPRSDWMECFRTDPVVDHALFERVQQKLLKNKSRLGGLPSDRFPLASLGKCPACGSAHCGVSKGENRWYRCIHRDRIHGHRLCPQRAVRAEDLEAAGIDVLKEEIGNELRLIAWIDRHRAELIGEVDTEESKQLMARLEKLRRQLVEAAEKELAEDDATLKKFYAGKVRDLRPQVAVLERRVNWMERAQARRFDVDTKKIAAAIRAALRTKVKSELRRSFWGGSKVTPTPTRKRSSPCGCRWPEFPLGFIRRRGAETVNSINMLLARGVARQREIGIRLALGAGRARVIRQLLVESVLLSLLGGAAAIPLSAWAGKVLWVWLTSFVQGMRELRNIELDVSPDAHVFAYGLALSLFTGVLFGLAPAIQSTRADLNTALKKEGSSTGGQTGQSRLRGLLLGTQVMISVLLLVVSGEQLRGLGSSFATAADLGYDARDTYQVRGSFGNNGATVLRRLQDRLEALPEVTRVAHGFLVTLPLPVTAGKWTGEETSYASEGFLETLSVPLLRGRSLTRQEAERGAPLAVISEATARRLAQPISTWQTLLHRDASAQVHRL